MRNNIKNYRIFEAEIRKNKGVTQDYIDNIDKDMIDKVYYTSDEATMKELIDFHQKIGFVPDIENMPPMPRLRPGQPMPPQSEMIRNMRFKWEDADKKKELEDLVIRIAHEQYGTIIESLNIEIDAKLTLPNNVLDDIEEIPDNPINIEPDEDLIPDIDKRKIVNSIVQGSAKNSHRLIHLYKDDFDSIEDGLTEIMDKVIKDNENKQWYKMLNGESGDGEQAPAGSSKIDYEDTEEGDDFKIKVIARGIDPIILLHEVVKGIYEALTQSGSLPEDAERAEKVVQYTDTKADEEEDLLYGEHIKKDLTSFITSHPDIDKIPNGIEYVCGEMVDMDTKSFLELIYDILIMKTEKSKKWLDQTVSKFVDEFKEYNKRKMEYDLGNQGNDNNISDVKDTDDDDDDDIPNLSKKDLLALSDYYLDKIYNGEGDYEAQLDAINKEIDKRF